MMTSSTMLADYDPRWALTFARLAERATAALAPIAVRIEHVGSTAVPGLAAKPVIDLDVVVSATEVTRAIEKLGTVGYVHEGDGGLAGREALRWPPSEARHHLYVCTPDAAAFKEHLLFRDYLRAHPDVAREYETLKRALAVRHATDRDVYQAGKADFIDSVMRYAAASGRRGQ